jgi:hypothetical protein
MAVAQNTVIIDDVEYKPGEQLPELGSIHRVFKDGGKRHYEGLAKDSDKLPLYVANNSSCFMTDTGEYYKFDESKKLWYKPDKIEQSKVIPIEVYGVLNGKIKQVSEDVEGIATPLLYKGSVSDISQLPLSPKIGWMYNISEKSIYGEAGMNVAWTGEIWDTLGPAIDMAPYLREDSEIITSLKTKTENLESANYTDRGTLADTDAFLINDGTGMKKSVLSKLSDFVLNKIADKVFAKLQTNDKTILGAINELNIIIGANNAAAHNAIYRGKNLGTQFTAEMSANIKNGTFKDMYCGDYLVINGTTYRFMDLDYLYKTGDTSLDTHHILVVPDAPMYNHVMNDTNTTEGGYVGSKMYKSGLDQALAKIKADFGEAHIVTYRNLLVNVVSNGAPSNWAWYQRQIDLMNEEMVYGTRAWSQTSQNGYDTGTNKSQLAAFKHNHSLISSCRSQYWLRAVQFSTLFCFVDSHGHANSNGASNSGGVRPWFLIS